MANAKILPLSHELLCQLELRDPLLLPLDEVVDGTTYGIVAAADKEILGAIGLVVTWPGVAQVWGLTGRLFKQYRVFCTRQIKRFLNTAINQFSLRYIQGYVDAGRPEAMHYARRFGFEAKALLPEYGPHREDIWIVIRRIEGN